MSLSSLSIPYLIIFIHSIASLSRQIIIGIDGNEYFLSNKGDLSNLYVSCKLIYHIAVRHGITGEPNTYLRESNTIDYFFCTEDLTKIVYKSGIIPFEIMKNSDHRALFLDIDLKR